MYMILNSEFCNSARDTNWQNIYIYIETTPLAFLMDKYLPRIKEILETTNLDTLSIKGVRRQLHEETEVDFESEPAKTQIGMIIMQVSVIKCT